MKEELKMQIIRLRIDGLGYKKIAAALNIPVEQVKYICKCNGYNGFAKNIKAKYQSELTDKKGLCKYCNKIFEQPKCGRRREYCSVECKRKWEKTHYKTHQHKCNYCGKMFESPSKRQKFCSQKCYYKYRFYREEDVAALADCLKKGKSPKFIPSWIKDLICGDL